MAPNPGHSGGGGNANPRIASAVSRWLGSGPPGANAEPSQRTVLLQQKLPVPSEPAAQAAVGAARASGLGLLLPTCPTPASPGQLFKEGIAASHQRLQVTTPSPETRGCSASGSCLMEAWQILDPRKDEGSSGSCCIPQGPPAMPPPGLACPLHPKQARAELQGQTQPRRGLASGQSGQLVLQGGSSLSRRSARVCRWQPELLCALEGSGVLGEGPGG
ncbi:hypothetical protein P7K49_024785 [Saguinus oedipus]|uniref:Uncharacterized protein n=1 Tax=Saguinus oedipus TaxID=9490 RepID=A0ABQ9UQH7_SAGOE|nr:hypothetical protein P7K49_024785 [Saguinus oedipus]